LDLTERIVHVNTDTDDTDDTFIENIKTQIKEALTKNNYPDSSIEIKKMDQDYKKMIMDISTK
jgi:molecular chaperone DnaK (HSP70)